MDWHQFLQPRGNGDAIHIRLDETSWGRNEKTVFRWQIRVGNYYNIGDGFGVTPEDALAQAAQSIIAFCITPADRRIYTPIGETESETPEC